MALDASLFTLHFVRRRNEPWIVDIYPTSSASTAPPPVPSKDPSSTSSSKPTAFSGLIPDIAAQRALALESNDFSRQTPSYTRVRATNHTSYSTILLDGLIPDILLASISQTYTALKKRTIQLYNPDAEVELEKRSMTFQQAHRFSFSDPSSVRAEEFSWKREGPSRGSAQSAWACEVIRKPDPNVLAAQYRPPAAKGKPGTLQLMDYNLARLEVADKKGLEVALVMTLSSLLDQEYDERIASKGEKNTYICSSGIPTDLSTQSYSAAWQEMERRHQSAVPTSSTVRSDESEVWEGNVDRIADLEPNEILVSRWSSLEEYVTHALYLLRCDTGQGMYLITLLSDSAETTPKTVQLAAAIKAAYYRLPDDAKGTVYGRSAAGVEEELYQYVQTLDSTPPASPAAGESRRRVIKLDAPEQIEQQRRSESAAGKYEPPSKLKILLSKERIMELEPKKVEGGSQSKSAVPSRPVEPARPVQQAEAQSGSTDKLGKGKALISKLLHH